MNESEHRKTVEWAIKKGLLKRPDTSRQPSPHTIKHYVYAATKKGDTQSRFYSPTMAQRLSTKGGES